MVLRNTRSRAKEVFFKTGRELIIPAQSVNVVLPFLQANNGGDGAFPTSGLSAFAGTDRATAARAAPPARDAVELVQGGAQVDAVRRIGLVP